MTPGQLSWGAGSASVPKAGTYPKRHRPFGLRDPTAPAASRVHSSGVAEPSRTRKICPGNITPDRCRPNDGRTVERGAQDDVASLLRSRIEAAPHVETVSQRSFPAPRRGAMDHDMRGGTPGNRAHVTLPFRKIRRRDNVSMSARCSARVPRKSPRQSRAAARMHGSGWHIPKGSFHIRFAFPVTRPDTLSRAGTMARIILGRRQPRR